MSRTVWACVRVLTGAAIIAVLVWRVGTGPFLHGIRTINAWSLLLAAAIAVVTTVGAAWRWRTVAHGLGVGLPLRSAVAAYYRSQFLNTVLPGGILGDVHRGVSHGRDAGNLGRGLRAVAWERSAAQIVQDVLTIVVLLVLPSPVRSTMPIIAGAVVVGALALVLLARVLPHDGPSWFARTLRAAGADIKYGLLARRAWPGIIAVTAVIVAGHAATFLIAAHTAGVTASSSRLLPLALLVLLVTALPTSIGGWGPREGAAAWAFGAAGLGVDQGVATSVVYGVMVFVACLPGAAVLLTEWLRRGILHQQPASDEATASDQITASVTASGQVSASVTASDRGTPSDQVKGSDQSPRRPARRAPEPEGAARG